ncbi:MAG: 4-hydroxy-3-methylbut-2-enyl diphosphate reductase [Syntrophales bacterium]|nr:4-hydroxy-3-methylbut-2-enyl diphosphate reductase [Syntrophales bacterium]
MGVKLAETAGFCMGVKRAVDIVLAVALKKSGERVFTYGPLIHNPQTVNLLRKRGIIPITSLDELESVNGKALVIIRAHGISPEERKRILDKGFRIIDATCPRVSKVQNIIKKHVEKGYWIMIVGDRDHPEVNGLLGFAEGKGIVVNDPKNIDILGDLPKVCVVAQTTQDGELFSLIAERVKRRFPDALIYNTICDSTEKRQREVRDLAQKMDAMVIVGGKNSANTRRLAALAASHGALTFHVESPEELDEEAISRFENIGISAGASTPNWIIDRVVERVTNVQRLKKGRFPWIHKLWTGAIVTDIYAAIGAGVLSFAAALMQGIPIHSLSILTASFFVFATHTLNRIVNYRTGVVVGSFREQSVARYQSLYLALAILASVFSLVFAYLSGLWVLALISTMLCLSVLYNIPLFPKGLRFRSIREIPGSKNVCLATAWGIVTTVVPQWQNGPTWTASMIFTFLFLSGLVFIRFTMTDILDLQNDKFMGRETIPVILGSYRAKKLIQGLTFFLLGLFTIGVCSGLAKVMMLGVASLVFFYLWICFFFCAKKRTFFSLTVNGLLETGYILTGFFTGLWALMEGYVKGG